MSITDLRTKNPLCSLAFGGYRSLDLGEIFQLRPWRGSSFEFGHARLPLRIEMDRGKRTPLRLGPGHSIFAAIYCKRSHLARGHRSARSRRDHPIALLKRLQLRVWPCAFASSHKNGSWQTHPLAPRSRAQHLCCYLLLLEKLTTGAQ